MSASLEAESSAKLERAEAGFVKLIGPGLIVAATGIGAGDVVSATVGGARYGEILLWGILLGAFFKYVLNEGVARFQLATGLTAIEGWARYLPVWVRVYFGAYLVLWTVAVTAALANACGLGISNLTFGAVPQSWGAALHSLAGAAFVLLGGFSGFQKIMKLLVGAMFFAIIGCAIVTLEDGGAVLSGLLIPRIPEGARRLRPLAHRRNRRLGDPPLVQLLASRGGHGDAALRALREEGPRARVQLHGSLRDLDHDHVEPRLPLRRNPDHRRAGGHEARGNARQPRRTHRASTSTRSVSGRRSSPRSSASGRASPTSTPTSMPSGRTSPPKSGRSSRRSGAVLTAPRSPTSRSRQSPSRFSAGLSSSS